MRVSSILVVLACATLFSNALAQVLIFDTHIAASCDSPNPPRQYAGTCGVEGEGCISVGPYNWFQNRSLCGSGTTFPPVKAGDLAVRVHGGHSCNPTYVARFDISSTLAGQNVSMNGWSLATYNPSFQTISLSCDSSTGVLSGFLCYPGNLCATFSLPSGVCMNITSLSTMNPNTPFSVYQDTCTAPVAPTAPVAAPVTAGPSATPKSATPVSSPLGKKSAANIVVSSLGAIFVGTFLLL